MSKRIWHHPELPPQKHAVTAWRSVGELEKSPAFQQHLEREFPEGSGHLSEEERESSRRSFMKLMGAASALSGLTLASCRRPEAYIVPYAKSPEWIVPGKPLFYASTFPGAEGAVPLVVTSHEGRPTMLAPNKEHPDSDGTNAFTQASVLNLYDTNRSRDVLFKGAKSSFRKFTGALAEIVKAPGKMAFLFGEDDCPTRHRLREELSASFPEAKFYSYEALRGVDRRKAHDEVLGEGGDVLVDFEKADRILSLDCDFLGLDLQGNSIAFSRHRQGGASDYRSEIAKDGMNRLYVVETAFSLTGGMADHRLRAKPSQVFRVAIDLAKAIASATGNAELAALSKSAEGLSPSDRRAMFGGKPEHYDAWIEACVADLVEAGSRKAAAVLAGTRQEEALQRLAIGMNKALQAYAGGPLQAVKTGRSGYGSISELAEDIDSETTVFLLGPSNPVYDTPADLDFGAALKRAKASIHVGLRTDATALASTWHLPGTHYLENWSDARTRTGVYSIVQPMILPLFGGISELELLAQLLSWKDVDWAKVESGEAERPELFRGEGPEGEPSPAYQEVRKTFAELAEEGDNAWKEALKVGFLGDSVYEPAEVGTVPSLADVLPEGGAGEGLEVSFMADGTVWDGRYIDNSWLQEAPDPISKMSWDNAAFVSPKTAKRLGVYDVEAELAPKNNTIMGKVANAPKPLIDEGKSAAAPVVLIEIGERVLRIPMMVAFGHADDCISIPLGYGQGATDGRLGVPSVALGKPYQPVGLVGVNTGFDANLLRTARHGGFVEHGAKVSTTESEYPIARVQEHHALYGRALAREVSTMTVDGESFEEQIAHVKQQGPVDSHAPENISIYKRQGSEVWEDNERKHADLISDPVHQWGMAIDLNTCIGCNACLVACQAENNIPIVGKEQVAMGREMHWIRMDRYYAAPTEVMGLDHEMVPAPEWVKDNPELVPQPVACVHCENAPCETVCPVNATVHTEEGLNAMVYNRCIGTRYCANNCPYKARRFNYFDYNKRNPLIEHNLYRGPFGETKTGEAADLQNNPNVSVRMRGVMEKCTYCVQRLQMAKIKQKQIGRRKALDAGKNSAGVPVAVEDLRIQPDTVQTACEEACPTEAISFGNLLDKQDSRAWRAKYKEEVVVDGLIVPVPNARNYDVLQYLGTVPRTSYLARVKNPNPEMPDAKYRGLATIHTA